MSKKPHGHRDPTRDGKRDPIADYKEWADRRYDPGYFTGGRLGPGIKWAQRNLSRGDKRVLLVLLILLLVAMVAAAIRSVF